MTRLTGRYEISVYGDEEVRAFIPAPLPPADPALAFQPDLLQQAHQEMARLEVASRMVPSLDWFIYAFVRKEAVVSSQIEGTQATLMDVLSFEATQHMEATDDVVEVCNYLAALKYAREQLLDPKGLPLSLRLLREVHGRLMSGVRGADKEPGSFRTSQNWIGGTRPGTARFVPPPPQYLIDCLGSLERYLHEDDALPPLVRAGLVHVQFETIHPFLDGNGRLGRLLVTLLLEHWRILSSPLLYLSLFFKRHRDEYYRRLSAVREAGDWEGWMQFFLEGVSTIAREATEAAQSLFARIDQDRRRLLAMPEVTLHAVQLFEMLPGHPILTSTRVVDLLQISKPTAIKTIAILESAQILKETTGRLRDRSYGYGAYLDVLCAETESLRPGR